jgi:tRNA threonylcarbamoyladenosine biosynthesis protein TsaE
LQLSYTLETIGSAASRFWEIAKQYRVVTFSGDMGAGKTTFISSLGALLQFQDHVSSPTFSLINEYRFVKDGREEKIFHIDWYRLRDEEEAINAGMEDCLDQARRGEAWCLIEWPEKAAALLSGPYLAVSIATTGPEDRLMEMTVVA